MIHLQGLEIWCRINSSESLNSGRYFAVQSTTNFRELRQQVVTAIKYRVLIHFLERDTRRVKTLDHNLN